MRRTLVQLTSKLYMSLEGLKLIQTAECLFVQTELHPMASWLAEDGIRAVFMDDLYEASDSFDDLNQRIAQRIASSPKDCVYAYTGSIVQSQIPYIRKEVEKRGDILRILPFYSGSEIAFPEWKVDRCIPAREWNGLASASETLCFEEVDSQLDAGELKRKLSEYYPDHWEVLLGDYCKDTGDYSVRKMPLYELDRCSGLNAASMVLVPACPLLERTRFGFEDLYAILKRLRRPGGCPWDQKQTHTTLKDSLLEETYEVIDAIDRGSDEDLCEELGDLWMNILFHSIIAEEQSSFTTRDVTTEIVEKLIYRHPHVFGNTDAATSDEVLKKWEELKKVEKHQNTQTDALHGVPKNFPALLRAAKVQKRASDIGFEWEERKSAAEKVAEELSETMEVAEDGNGLNEECGDLLFAAVNLIRMMKINPELALQDATDKFIDRFSSMEKLILGDGKTFAMLDREQLVEYWNLAKHMQPGKWALPD